MFFFALSLRDPNPGKWAKKYMLIIVNYLLSIYTFLIIFARVFLSGKD